MVEDEAQKLTKALEAAKPSAPPTAQTPATMNPATITPDPSASVNAQPIKP